MLHTPVDYRMSAINKKKIWPQNPKFPPLRLTLLKIKMFISSLKLKLIFRDFFDVII